MKGRVFLLALTLVTAAVAAAQDLPLLTTNTPVGPRDILDVRVLEEPAISGQVTVSDDGQIVLNLLGKVSVSGLTVSQIENKLKTQLETNILTKATVAVQVVQFASKPISVLGAVVRPGLIGASGTTTLIEAITQAGGLAQGHGTELTVRRTGQNGLTEQLSISIDELMVQGNPDVNIPLAPNDIINVPVDATITIYVMGEVMRPGKVQFKRSQTPTLLQALADSGGPTDRASRMVVVKRMVNGTEQRIERNYKRIIAGREKDIILQDNDVVVLAEAIF
jgi:polysaccharide biosynthesis/export protein